jgi:serine/threonine protein kinase
MTGETLSHFEILDKLGEGGMGVVYKARGTRLNRLVAIKVLPADRVADPERKRRFVQEAQAASALFLLSFETGERRQLTSSSTTASHCAGLLP